MSKKITGTVRLLVPSGKANPSPPVGPALGQRSVNIMDFCKQFNERTKHFKEGILIPVDVTVFNDKSFSFNIKTPSVSYFLKQLIGNGPRKLTLLQLYEIAKIKHNDSNLKNLNINKIVSMLIGSAKSMKIEIF